MDPYKNYILKLKWKKIYAYDNIATYIERPHKNLLKKRTLYRVLRSICQHRDRRKHTIIIYE